MDMHFDGMIFQTHALELRRRIEREWPPFVLVDTRAAAEFGRGHIPGAHHAPVEILRNSGLPGGADQGSGFPGSEFIVIGRGPGDPDVRSASLLLQQAGARRIVELAGGMVAWDEGRHPLSTSNAA